MLRISLPTRVSRLYPVFSLTLAIACAVLTYAWQSTLLELNRVSEVQQHQKELLAKIDTLTTEHQDDKAKIQVQLQKIDEATASLNTVQGQLDSKNKELATTQQQLTQAQTQLKSQQDQLSQNASEIDQLRARPPLFSFQNQSSQVNIEQQEADVKELVTTAYDYMVQLYGQPYLLSSITITFVDQFSIAGAAGEVVITNSDKGIATNIHLKSFDKNSFQDINTVLHEITHSFHGVAVLKTSAMEEGATVAATDAVMQQMIADGKIPSFSRLYLSLTDQQYADYNATLRVPEDNQLFYTSPDVAKVYQLIGTAWMRFYKQDRDFFKKFNAAYYAKVQQGIQADDPFVRQILTQVEPTVNGQSTANYLASNKAFNPS